MTRVLVVHHDHDVADAEVDELRRAGYEVEQCAGPVGAGPCPVVQGLGCWQVEDADVLLYDVWAAGDAGRELMEDLRARYPDKPVVLTSGGLLLDWAPTTGPGQVTPVFGPPNRALLSAAVEAALAEAQADAGARAEEETAPGRPSATGHPAGVTFPRW